HFVRTTRLLYSTALLALCGIVHCRLFAQVAEPMNYLQPVVLELKRAWPTNRRVNVVCHGHSVPAGYFKTPVVDTFHAYPHLLHVAVKDRFPRAVVNVIVTA